MPAYRHRVASFTSAATPGLSKMAASIGQAMSPVAQQQAQEQGGLYQSRMAQALAQIGASDASARLHDAQAAEHQAKTGMLTNRGGVFNEMVASEAGVDVPTVFSYRNKLDGVPDQVPMGPPTEEGQMGIGSRQFEPELVSKLARSMRQYMPLITNAGDINPDQMAKASTEYRNQALSDAIINGTMERNKVGGAQAAAAGKDLFKADSTGSVLDQFGGQLDTSNPMAGATIAERAAAAREKDSAVGRNQAQASAALTTANAHMITASRPRGGGRGIVRDTANGLVMIDPETGESKPVLDENGEPMRGKATDKPMTEGQAKANLFGSRMREADAILGELGGNYSQAAINAKNGAEGVPLIGGLLGMAGNAMLPEKAQRAEQAQRDYINAVLRRESGAAIAASEFSNAAKQYFPQPGDGKEVIAQKARNRQVAIDGLMAEVPEQYRMKPAPAAGVPVVLPSAGAGMKASGMTTSPARVAPQTQAAMDSDQAKLLLHEYQTRTSPADKAAVARELKRMGIPVPAAPAASAAPQATATAASAAAPTGWTYLGKE